MNMLSILRNLYHIEMVSNTIYSGECSGALNNDMKELSIDGMEWVVKCLKAFFMLWFVLALMNYILVLS